jgi:hypothetical protein
MIKVVGPADIFEYYLNDPTTPNLSTRVPVPKIEDIRPRISVMGFREGPLVQEDSIRVQAASVYLSIITTMHWINKIRPIERWAATDVLQVVPRAGRQLNAFYDRLALRFFYDVHPITRKVIFTADSTEAVYHEFGHAVLDSFRPDLWDLGTFEVFAFHEAFGDIISMLSSLQHPIVVLHALRETNGDLSLSNIVSRISEEFGNALYHAEPHKGRPSNCLRDASVPFIYQRPETLPVHGSYKQLCREAHNFSRVFSSAWYSVFVNLYNRFRNNNSDEEAVNKARDIMSFLSIKSLSRLIKKPQVFSSAAQSYILTNHEEMGGEHLDILRRVLIKRQLLDPVILY